MKLIDGNWSKWVYDRVLQLKRIYEFEQFEIKSNKFSCMRILIRFDRFHELKFPKVPKSSVVLTMIETIGFAQTMGFLQEWFAVDFLHSPNQSNSSNKVANDVVSIWKFFIIDSETSNIQPRLQFEWIFRLKLYTVSAKCGK